MEEIRIGNFKSIINKFTRREKILFLIGICFGIILFYLYRKTILTISSLGVFHFPNIESRYAFIGLVIAFCAFITYPFFDLFNHLIKQSHKIFAKISILIIELFLIFLSIRKTDSKVSENKILNYDIIEKVNHNKDNAIPKKLQQGSIPFQINGIGKDYNKNIESNIENPKDTIATGFVIASSNISSNDYYLEPNLINNDNNLLPSDLEMNNILKVSGQDKIINLYQDSDLNAHPLTSWVSGTFVQICSKPIIKQKENQIWIKIKKIK